jgi:hypothetical protein
LTGRETGDLTGGGIGDLTDRLSNVKIRVVKISTSEDAGGEDSSESSDV